MLNPESKQNRDVPNKPLQVPQWRAPERQRTVRDEQPMNAGRAVCYVWALGTVLLGFSMFLVGPYMRQKYHSCGGPVIETIIVLIGTLWLVAIFSSKRKTVDASADSKKKVKARRIAITLLVLGGSVGSILLISHVRKVRDRNTCLNNMRQITSGIWGTGLAMSISNGAVVPVEEVVPYLKNGLPKCPSGGTLHDTRDGR